MKKIILMLAMFGAFATTQAQVMQKPVRPITPMVSNYEEAELIPFTPFFLSSGILVPKKVTTTFKNSYGSPQATWNKETIWFDRNGLPLGSNGSQMAHHSQKPAVHKTKTTEHNLGVKYHHAGHYK